MGFFEVLRERERCPGNCRRIVRETDMNERKPTVAYLTAGAAGMFCGSCMHDNTLAAGLMRAGWDVHLIPTYTPIRTDEENVADQTVLYGGINVYLQQKLFIFRYLPTFLDRWLDHPKLINWLASRAVQTDASQLGAMTVSILRGERGFQRKEVRRLVQWLSDHVRPDLINLSNILIAGCVPALKRHFGCPIVVTLQGDDIFLGELPEPYKSQAIEEIRRIAEYVDGYITFSEYYRDFMSEMLSLPRDRFRIVPLGIKVADFPPSPLPPAPRQPTVGYLARICPEKGLHVLADAFCKLRTMPGTENARLRIAGWLGKRDEPFFQREMEKFRKSGCSDGPDGDVHYAGVIDRQQKLEFLSSLDILSVPTVYREPKGIFVVEALASGIPVVQPEHGAFPEILKATQGGLLCRPNDSDHLAELLHQLLTDPQRRSNLATAGRDNVHRTYDVGNMTQKTTAFYEELLRLKTG